VTLALKRFLAYWIDFVVLGSFLVSLQGLIFRMTSGFPFVSLDQGYKIELWVLLTFSLPVWLYFVWCETVKRQTLGKRLLKLVVVSETGTAIGWKQALLRTFVRLPPWELTHLIILIPTPWWSVEHPPAPWRLWIPNLMIGIYIAVLFATGGHRGLHDVIGKTRVKARVKERSSP